MTIHKLLAGLTAYNLTRDRNGGPRYPVIPDDPGVIHAIRPTATEPTITEPYFIEDTQHYRAGICGALVKVIMPLSFKPAETGACPECLEELGNPSSGEVWLANPFITGLVGDSWWSRGGYKNPGWLRRRQQERVDQGHRAS